MKLQLILPADYVEQASRAVDSATTRVSLISMVIADHPATHQLIESLIAAAKRGVSVHVAADIFTYGEVSGSFLPIRYDKKDSRAATSMARRLKAAGVKFHWLGNGRVTLFNGRTHSKWCVVDDTVFTFGGVNLYEQGIKNADYMFKATDNTLANILSDEQIHIQRAERAAQNFPSHRKAFDNFSVLFDGGIIGHSIIYKRACELSKQAESVVFVSQYCPTGKLARILKTKPTRLYFNRTEQASVLNKALLWVSQTVSGLRTSYQKDTYLHAKYIIFTMPDGSKTALSGSHNFAYSVVLFGTREVALETKDPAIIKQLESFTEKYIA